MTLEKEKAFREPRAEEAATAGMVIACRSRKKSSDALLLRAKDRA